MKEWKIEEADACEVGGRGRGRWRGFYIDPKPKPKKRAYFWLLLVVMIILILLLFLFTPRPHTSASVLELVVGICICMQLLIRYTLFRDLKKLAGKEVDATVVFSGFGKFSVQDYLDTNHLVRKIEEKEESVWASALSCLLYFVCGRGKLLRNRINGLDIRVVKALLVTNRKNSCAEVVHCKPVSMLANMSYQVPEETDETVSSTRLFVVEQVDLIGGIEFIFLRYATNFS